MNDDSAIFQDVSIAVISKRSLVEPSIRKVMVVKSRFPRTARRIPNNRISKLQTAPAVNTAVPPPTSNTRENEVVQIRRVYNANTKKPAADR